MMEVTILAGSTGGTRFNCEYQGADIKRGMEVIGLNSFRFSFFCGNFIRSGFIIYIRVVAFLQRNFVCNQIFE